MEFLIRYLLPIAYALLAGWWLARNRFLVQNGIPIRYTLLFLYAKIATGLFYTYVMIHLVPKADDIDLLFGGGLEMYNAFWHDPAGFPGYLAEIFAINDFRLGHTDSEFIRKVFDGIKFIHFLLNFLSAGEIYTNVLLFNCLAAWLFLRCWVHLKNYFGHWWFGGWIFLFPSAFFFTSVLLKEGIELTIIAALIPLLLRKNQPGRVSGWVGILGLFFLLSFFKYLIAATFLGALFLFLLYKKFPARKGLITLLSIACFIILFFSAGYFHKPLHLPQYIIDRRVEFQELEANSALEMKTLEPSLFGFLKVLPEALHNVLFRPWPGEGGKLTYLVFSAEIIVFWLIMVYLVVRRRGRILKEPGPEAWAFLLFALINLVIIGYTITNIGAITRYRSIFLPGIGYFIWMLYYGSELSPRPNPGNKQQVVSDQAP